MKVPPKWMIAEKRFWVNPLHLKTPETQLKTWITPFAQIPNSLNQVPDFFPTLNKSLKKAAKVVRLSLYLLPDSGKKEQSPQSWIPRHRNKRKKIPLDRNLITSFRSRLGSKEADRWSSVDHTKSLFLKHSTCLSSLSLTHSKFNKYPAKQRLCMYIGV